MCTTRISPPDVDAVIAFLEANGRTHTRWAEHFEAYPEIEAEYLATGVWDDAKEHRRLEAGYNDAVTLLRALAKSGPD